jgi:hypothetical protein
MRSESSKIPINTVLDEHLILDLINKIIMKNLSNSVCVSIIIQKKKVVKINEIVYSLLDIMLG